MGVLDCLLLANQCPESISQVREKTIQRLLDLPYTYLTRYDGHSSLCKLKSASCDAIICGSLLLQLGRHYLWPKKNAARVTDSVKALADHIRGLNPTSLPKLVGAEHEDHSACKGPSFKDEVNKIMKSIPSAVLDCHLKHMEKRRNPATPEEDTPVEEGASKDSKMVRLKIRSFSTLKTR